MERFEDVAAYLIGTFLSAVIKLHRKVRKTLRKVSAPICAFSYFEGIQLCIIAVQFKGKIFGLEMNPDIVWAIACVIIGVGSFFQFLYMRLDEEE